MAKKVINDRCPLADECERKTCVYKGHELDCIYYDTNGEASGGISDQEQRRRERERRAMDEFYEERFKQKKAERSNEEKLPAPAAEVLPVREASEIALEINIIKRETWEICARSSIKIGELLNEAKASVGHGNWENWLRDNVDYSISTAQRLMKLADTYGGQLISGEEDAVTEAIASMLPSKALLLAQLEPEQRREYVENHDVESESTREMREQIRILKAEKEQLVADLDAETGKAQSATEQLEAEKAAHAEALKKAIAENEDIVKRADEADKLKKEVETLKQKLEKAEAQKKSAQEAAEQAKVEVKPDPVLETEIERLRKEVAEAEGRANTIEEEYRRKLERAANPNMQAFLYAVQAWQRSSAELLQHYATVKADDAEGAEKFATAIKQQIAALEQSL